MKVTNKDNIPDFINKISSLINEINFMHTQFKVNDMIYGGMLVIAMSSS